jgi:hypothetical protein
MTTVPEHWEWGDWPFGEDYSGGSRRVVALLIKSDGWEPKHPRFVGPLELTFESAVFLTAWAARVLNLYGGYVHLLPADGDALNQLEAEVAEMEEDG